MVKFSPLLNRGFTFLMGTAVKALGAFKDVDETLVLFVSDIGKSFSGSPRAIYEYLHARELDRGLRIVWAFKDPEKYSGMPFETVKLDSPAYFSIALQAAVWVTDVNIERGLKFKKKGTFYLNTWHGTSFKTLGKDIHGRVYQDSSSIDRMCASSEYDVTIFSSAFDLSREVFLRSGLPRNDVLFQNAQTDSSVFKRRIGLPCDKRIALYAPTWRDTHDGGQSYTISPPIDIDLWRERLGEDWIVLFRMHPLTQAATNIRFDGAFVRDCSHYQPVEDLMLAADVLVTDYSSIAFDYAILKRPVLCFGYDLEAYKRVRGLYLEPEDVFPKSVALDEETLLQQIRECLTWQKDDYLAPLYTDYCAYGGDAARNCLTAIADNASEPVRRALSNYNCAAPEETSQEE